MNPTKYNPDGYIMTDETATGTWADKVNFRQPNVKAKMDKRTTRINSTGGEMFATKHDKRENPHLWETSCYAKDHHKVAERPRLIKKGK